MNGVKVQMKIDSGSEVNVIGQDVYQQILNNSQKKIMWPGSARNKLTSRVKPNQIKPNEK